MTRNSEKYRCQWCLKNPLMMHYHDHEWGVPVHDDRLLFEFLILEGTQAGLSWQTILNKREAYRKAFDQFDAKKISHYGEKEVARLLEDTGIIRNRLKIAAAIGNAQAFLKVQEEFDSFNNYIWSFVHGKPINNNIKAKEKVPCSSNESEIMSKDLVKRGFKFVGSTICYSFMQAVGMVNDHETVCFRHREV